MDYEGLVIRPPSEADSILLQVTVGCSHNKCAFCGAYKAKRFGFKDRDTVWADIEEARTRFPDRRRLFLCDGDALVMPQDRLLELLARIRERLPGVARVGTYANAKSLGRKSLDELRALRDMGLSMVYMGLESGHDPTLAAMGKGATAARMVEQGQRARQAGLKLNVTVILGLAGEELSQEHAEATGRALTAMDPEQAAALTLMLVEGTPLHETWRAGGFALPDERAMLRELRTMLAHTELTRGLFLANHASNYLPIRARLPRDKEATLALIDQGLAGDIILKPEWLRRL